MNRKRETVFMGIGILAGLALSGPAAQATANSAGFTLDTYAHVTGEMQKEAADRMGSFIAQAI